MDDHNPLPHKLKPGFDMFVIHEINSDQEKSVNIFGDTSYSYLK